jgi:uncharacterized protein YbbC (DUF1343 family)
MLFADLENPRMRNVTGVLIILLFVGGSAAAPVKFGIDVLRDENFKSLDGKRVGLVANPASVDSNLVSTATLFSRQKNFTLVSLFGPEHGIWGDEYAGDKITDRTDPATKLPIYSLYGKTRKPTTRSVLPIDTLVFDLQDIGSRSYTYISTLKVCMEACAQFNIEMVILDRPNPLGGVRIEGPQLHDGFESFVGFIPVPYVHGMTIGEMAMFVQDKYFPQYKKLKVIRMQGWNRDMVWRDTERAWVPTSPHIPKMETCAAYAATGILGELYAVNIGVGYTLPFEMCGAPYLDGEALANAMPKQRGVVYRPAHFKPFYGTFKGEKCEGVQVHIDPKTAENIVEINYRLARLIGAPMLFRVTEQVFQKQENEAAKKAKRKPKTVERYKMFDKVSGSDEPRKWLLSEKPLEPLFEQWRRECTSFGNARKKYLLY